MKIRVMGVGYRDVCTFSADIIHMELTKTQLHPPYLLKCLMETGWADVQHQTSMLKPCGFPKIHVMPFLFLHSIFRCF